MIPSVTPWDGKTITGDGLFGGVPASVYHSGTLCGGREISASGLKLIWSPGPKHFFDQSPLNPKRAPDESTPALNMGLAAHHVLFRQAAFSAEFAIQPAKFKGAKFTNARNDCKAWTAAQRAAGKTIITEQQAEDVKGMAIELGRNELVRTHGILSGLVETTMCWTDPETKVRCRARPDIIPVSDGDYIDLKTTASVLYTDIAKSIANFGYVQQAAFVLEGALALGLEVTSFTLVFIEKTRPYAIRIVSLTDEDVVRGQRMNRVCLRTFADCLDSGKWPGPGGDQRDAEYVQLPEWWRKSTDDRLRLELSEDVAA